MQTQTRRRAVDSPIAFNMQNGNTRDDWGKIVRLYGVQFIIRIHLRKCEFRQVRLMLQEKRIVAEADLLFLASALQRMEEQALVEEELKIHVDSIQELRQLADLRIQLASQQRANQPVQSVQPDPTPHHEDPYADL
ncbi:MAG: hypothetical protein K8S54_15005 [Spirochaetia bacterium]|nr:hypothetical protein [Spirochaetia bacterium]